jgi:hypothetical protein
VNRNLEKRRKQSAPAMNATNKYKPRQSAISGKAAVTTHANQSELYRLRQAYMRAQLPAWQAVTKLLPS